MSGAACDLRHELAREDGTGQPLLHVYLPEGLEFSEWEVTTGSNPNVAEVFIEHVATNRVLGRIELQGYAVAQDHAVVKLSKKHRRFTIRLSEAAPVADTATPAEPAALSASPGDSTAAAAPATPASPPPAITSNIFGLLDNDDVSDDEDGGGEAAAGGGKKKKKKKKGKAAAGGECQGGAEALEAPIANGDHADTAGAGAGGVGAGEENEGAAVPEGGEGATGAAKKKKKRKKKGAACVAAAAGEGDAVIGGTEAEVEAEEEALPDRAASPPPEPAAAAPVPAASSAPQASAPLSAISSALPKSASRSLSVDLTEDFGEQYGSFEVGAAAAHDPLLGPAVHHALGKVQVKREDMWLEAPTNAWSVKGLEGAVTPVSAFGIFDGHGGRVAAQYAAKQLLPLVAKFAERTVGPEAPSGPEELAAEGYLFAEQKAGEDKVALERARVAAAQDALVARLPKALHAGFVQCDEEVIARHKASGTTATLAVQVGWELLVANVGDSLAYLDTGSEIVVISANHRVAESADEQARVVQAGGRIKPAKYGEDDDDADGSPGSATPHEGQQLRVWPGGINMTRTIGDEAAKGLLIAEPAVRQISLPVTGARLIVASDGLWDAVNAKTVIGQLRTCNAREAASKAAVYAMRNKKHDDDVTVVVADFVPRDSDTHVPGLLKKGTGPAAAALAALAAAGMKEERAAQSWRPLEVSSESWRERHRAHRQRAAAYLQQLQLAERAEAEAAVELERQQRMAVAPAAGTAGVGTAVRPPPVSDTFRELAELKVNIDTLDDEPPEAGEGGEQEEWTQVDARRKKEAGGGFDLQRELLSAARPGDVRPARSPGGGGGIGGNGAAGAVTREEGGARRERGGIADRERRLSRRERESAAAVAAEPAEAATTAARQPPSGDEPGVAVDQLQPQQQHQRRQLRADRLERSDRRGRGGRGGRGRELAAGGPRSGGMLANAAEVGAINTAPPAAPTALLGVVKAERYLYVPKALLSGGGVGGGGGGGTVPAAVASATTAELEPEALSGGGEGGAGGHGNKARRERPRGPAQSRRDTAAPPADAVHDGPDGAGDAGEPVPAAAEGAGPAPSNARRTQQRRRQRETDVAAFAASETAPNGLLAATAPPAAKPVLLAHVATPATSSSDPVVVLEPSAGHHQQVQHPQQPQPQRPQQQRYGGSHQAAYKEPKGAPRAALNGSHSAALQQHPPVVPAAGPPPPANPDRPQGAAQALASHYPSRQQPQPLQPRAYQQPVHEQKPAQRTQQAALRGLVSGAAAAPPVVPTYSGPLDFGAGFGPGSGMWPPTGGGSGQFGGFPVVGRPAVPGGGPVQRNPDEVAAAAAAAAAAAVARKAAAARGGSSGSGQFAHGRT